MSRCLHGDADKFCSDAKKSALIGAGRSADLPRLWAGDHREGQRSFQVLQKIPEPVALIYAIDHIFLRSVQALRWQ